MLRKLGAEVRTRRESRNLTQEKLALKADLSTTVVRRIEKGVQNFEIGTLLAIAEQLNASAAELFADAEKRS